MKERSEHKIIHSVPKDNLAEGIVIIMSNKEGKTLTGL